jgi:hypothetical protein
MIRRTARKSFQRSSLYLAVLPAIVLCVACGPNEAILNSNATAANTNVNAAAVKTDPIDEEVRNMETANFDYIFVLERKDGGAMSADDKTFIRNVTANANRRSLTSDDQAVVIGSNSPPTADFIGKLSSRFEVKNLSRLPLENSNANAAANANIGH